MRLLEELRGDKRPNDMPLLATGTDSFVCTAEKVSTAADNCFVVNLLVAAAEPVSKGTIATSVNTLQSDENAT